MYKPTGGIVEVRENVEFETKNDVSLPSPIIGLSPFWSLTRPACRAYHAQTAANSADLAARIPANCDEDRAPGDAGNALNSRRKRPRRLGSANSTL